LDKFEKLKKWFLFSNNKNEENENRNLNNIQNKNNNKFNPFNSNENIRCNISIERLSKPKKYGGFSLFPIKEISYSLKTKFLINSTKKENKYKPCYTILNNILEIEYFNQNKNILIPHLHSN
jgi:hypothetical protein